MKLASYSTASGSGYGCVVGDGVVALSTRLGDKAPTLRDLLAKNLLGEAAKLAQSAKPDFALSAIAYPPVIPNPGKIVCVGLNYEEHRVETGRDKTENPALFIRVAESQVGHNQPIVMPKESTNLDFEGEIAVVIGKRGRRISEEDAWNTSRATPATTTARCATGSATPCSGPRARTSAAPAASGRGW